MPDYRLPDGAVPVLLSSDTADGLRGEAVAILGYLERHPDVIPDRVADMLFRTRVARRRYRRTAVPGRLHPVVGNQASISSSTGMAKIACALVPATPKEETAP